MIKLLAPPIKKLTDGARELRRRALSGGQWFAGISQNMGQPRPPVVVEAISFQDPIDEICEESPPRFMRSMLYVVFGLFVLTILLASLISVEVVVVGSGRLATETPPIMLQPLDRSIVREVNVKPGDVVTKGEVLATLDPTFAQADLASVSAKQVALLAQIRRLDAELNNQPFQPSSTPTAEEQLQAILFVQRQSQYASQLRVFDEEIQRRRANITTIEAERAAQAKQLTIAKEVETMRATMLEKQSGSKLNYLEAQSVRMRVEQSFLDAGNRLAEAKHDLQSKEAERQSFVDTWRQQILENLVNSRTEASIIGETMAKATLVNNLVVLTAPEDGVVLDVAKRSVGSVLNGAEPLITISPTNANVIAEIMISSADIGYVKPGDDVVVKVDAFPWQRHGLLKGKLLSVSEESFSTSGSNGQNVSGNQSANRSGAVHRGIVKMTDTTLEDLPKGARLIPGMTLAAEIKVGTRSVMSFFLNPITRGLRESIREP
ncbi:MAG: HlyD family type I secretion periplasmic adaptor subunit [Rhodospirillaceae bacterium]|nr:HlyD family type I secretion periplasmic adaptor subunit [Rhodospirillaceae bacterium]